MKPFPCTRFNRNDEFTGIRAKSRILLKAYEGMSEEKEGALARWSRRKLDADSSGEAKGQDTMRSPSAGSEEDVGPDGLESRAALRDEVPVTPDPACQDETDGASSDEGARDVLPDIDTLTYESDFTAFMREGVPAHLRNLALRKLWSSNPILANVDGLNDYDLDYTITEFVQIATESAEDILRGTKRESAHDLRRRERDGRRGTPRAPARGEGRSGPERRGAGGGRGECRRRRRERGAKPAFEGR
jgi:hypothetical protein